MIKTVIGYLLIITLTPVIWAYRAGRAAMIKSPSKMMAKQGRKEVKKIKIIMNSKMMAELLKQRGNDEKRS